jgi:hypothetical protein
MICIDPFESVSNNECRVVCNQDKPCKSPCKKAPNSDECVFRCPNGFVPDVSGECFFLNFIIKLFFF